MTPRRSSAAQAGLFSPSLPPIQTYPINDQLQSMIPETSPPTMNRFPRSPNFEFGFGKAEADVGSSGKGIGSGDMRLDQVIAGGGPPHTMGMDMDDPILNSLQTLAETRDFGENLGEPQNFNVWEWFDQQ